MEDSNLKIMKRIFSGFLIALMFACGQDNSSKEEILDANPYLIGEWIGTGGFMDRFLPAPLDRPQCDKFAHQARNPIAFFL